MEDYKKETKRTFIIFTFAFVANLVWENLHSRLYLAYGGGPITEIILWLASFWDAVIIVVIFLPFLHFNFLKSKPWIIFVLGVAISLAIEWYALATNRWAYGPLMPIIPFLGTGLTPTLQLGLLGYLAYKFEKYASARWFVILEK